MSDDTCTACSYFLLEGEVVFHAHDETGATFVTPWDEVAV